MYFLYFSFGKQHELLPYYRVFQGRGRGLLKSERGWVAFRCRLRLGFCSALLPRLDLKDRTHTQCQCMHRS